MIFSHSWSAYLRASAVILLMVTLVACGNANTTDPTQNSGPFATFLKDVEFFNIAHPVAVVETDQGTFAIELYKTQAPNSVAHFIAQAIDTRYDGSSVYNTISNFAVYLGDKSGAAKEALDVEPINLETHPDLKHDSAGVVGLVHESGAQCVSSPNKEQCAKDSLNSAKTFFYITLSPQPTLDGSYAVFGKVAKGLEIVKGLRKGNKITKITILQK
ncbi:MAG: peptidylprolyl isomerase [Candidatus Abawacabacteria bacterium]|nr:peptidylprolyl isomerase [Candidatus Abawacabacteria bacterium]